MDNVNVQYDVSEGSVTEYIEPPTIGGQVSLGKKSFKEVDGKLAFVEKCVIFGKEVKYAAECHSVLMVNVSGRSIDVLLPRDNEVILSHNESLWVSYGVEVTLSALKSSDVIFFYFHYSGSDIKHWKRSLPPESVHCKLISDELLFTVVNLLYLSMFEETSNSTRITENIIRVIIDRLFYNLFESASPPNSKAKKLSHRMRCIITFIKDNINQNLSTKNIAKHMNVSKSHMHKIFMTQVGCTPSRFVLLIRLREARFLLRNTHLPCGHISEFCGFSSASQLSRAFQQAYSLCPLAYRKQSRTSLEEIDIIADTQSQAGKEAKHYSGIGIMSLLHGEEG